MVTMVSEREIQMQKGVYLCFIEYEKAFDKLWHKDLFEMLRKLDLFGKYIRTKWKIY